MYMSRRYSRRFICLLFVGVLVGSGIIAVLLRQHQRVTILQDQKHTYAPIATITIASVPVLGEQTLPVPKNTVGVFSGQEFATLYRNRLYPNVAPQSQVAPDITGDPTADAIIRQLAEERGYRRQQVAVSTEAIQGFTLQQPAANAWVALQSAAQTAGYTMELVAGYREYGLAQTMFVAALNARGATPQAIAQRAVDGQVRQVLTNNAPPGYSRHHTGYAVDIACKNTPGVPFGGSPCATWLSTNNFANAKKFGWMPSYPPDGPPQGPSPEPWEYLWVGTDVLQK